MSRMGPSVKPLGLLLAGVFVTLLAQFALEGAADQSDLAHWIQHGLLFWGGIAVGVGGVVLLLRGRRRV